MPLSKTEKEYIKKIGKRIVQLREGQNMKQIELATAVNIEDSALRRIESGRTNPTVKTLLRIAVGLGVNVRDLFEDFSNEIDK
ncbi:MAG: helix-turn-helix transcriptional regulator [bacterium]|nr:helix-turn-helix transcriptional regulator [bacterium]